MQFVNFIVSEFPEYRWKEITKEPKDWENLSQTDLMYQNYRTKEKWLDNFFYCRI